METFPKVGMTYNQVRDRLIKDRERYQMNPNMQKSILEQVRACEGDHAMSELAKEVDGAWGMNTLNCSGNKQTGVEVRDRVPVSEDPTFENLGSGRFRKVYGS